MLDLFFALINLTIFGGLVAFLFFRYGAPLIYSIITAEKATLQKRTEKQIELTAAQLANKNQKLHTRSLYSDLEKKVTAWKAYLKNEEVKRSQEFFNNSGKRQENHAFRARTCALLVLEKDIIPAALNKARAHLRDSYNNQKNQDLVLENIINKIKQL